MPALATSWLMILYSVSVRPTSCAAPLDARVALPQAERAADRRRFALGGGDGRPAAAAHDHAAEPLGDDVGAAHLVDEVDGAAVERDVLVVDQRAAGQEGDRDVDAPVAHRRQHVDARHAGQRPVEQEGVRLRRPVQLLEEGGPVGEAAHREAPVLQLCHHGLEIELVIVDEQHAVVRSLPVRRRHFPSFLSHTRATNVRTAVGVSERSGLGAQGTGRTQADGRSVADWQHWRHLECYFRPARWNASR